MTEQKKDIAVYYNANSWNKELGNITQEQAQSLITQITNSVTDDYSNRCLGRIRIEYRNSIIIHPLDTNSSPTEHKELRLSGIELDLSKPSWCTTKYYVTQESAELHCIKNMISGKCKCPVMGKIGAVLMPTFYKGQSKER